MPLFTYYCKKCRETSEILVRGSEKPACPKCGALDLVKQTSAIMPKMGRSKAPAAGGCAGCCSRESCPNAAR
jgi:putative FmdB family regulatory protein